jgi:peptide/nickel transport system permease protein
MGGKLSGYLIRRCLLSFIVLWGVLTLSYILTALAPGDVAETMVGQRADEDTLRSMRASLGIDRDPVTRYFLYLKELAAGRWGESARYNEPVWSLILERAPRTAALALAALSFAVILGVTLGVIAGVFRGTWIDKAISYLSLAGISAPVFWVGLILIWVLSLQLRWLPPAGYEQGNLRYLILPALTLGLRSIALIARITRVSIVELASSQYLKTAVAKGLSPFRVYGKHALRNAALPIVTVIGLDLGSYLSGSVLTEKVFGWPGLGRLVVDAILARDTAVINACVVFMAMIFVLVNLGIDLLYGAIDPRVRSVK